MSLSATIGAVLLHTPVEIWDRCTHSHRLAKMAEVEVDVVADAPAVEPTGPPAQEELPSYDDSLLIKVKGKVKKPVRPDDTERNIQIEKLNAEVKKYSERIAEIKTTVQAIRSRGPNPEADVHRKKKELLRAEWSAVLVRPMGTPCHA